MWFSRIKSLLVTQVELYQNSWLLKKRTQSPLDSLDVFLIGVNISCLGRLADVLIPFKEFQLPTIKISLVYSVQQG